MLRWNVPYLLFLSPKITISPMEFPGKTKPGNFDPTSEIRARLQEFPAVWCCFSTASDGNLRLAPDEQMKCFWKNKRNLKETKNVFVCVCVCVCVWHREVTGNVEVMQLDFEMENFTSLSVTRRINWNIDYRGQNPSLDSEKVVTELTVVQRDIQAIIPLAMVSVWLWSIISIKSCEPLRLRLAS